MPNTNDLNPFASKIGSLKSTSNIQQDLNSKASLQQPEQEKEQTIKPAVKKIKKVIVIKWNSSLKAEKERLKKEKLDEDIKEESCQVDQ